MKSFWKTLCAGGLAFAMGATAIAPASALPRAPAPIAPTSTETVPEAQSVQFVNRGEFRRLQRNFRGSRGVERRIGRAERRLDRRDARRFARGFERRGNRGYYRGYRGYRYARPGYRYHNGFYFPSAAFIAGALINGAIANSARPRGNSHVSWCYNRFRSYRASDNTYQPTRGPRRQCNSPFD